MSKLQEVRDLLTDPAHWAQRTFGNEHSKCFCLVGAVNFAQGRDPAALQSSRDPAIKVIAEIIKPGCPDYSRDGIISTWNDQPTRTHDEVLQLLDQALEIAHV